MSGVKADDKMNDLWKALVEWRRITFTDYNPKEPTMAELDQVARNLRDAYDKATANGGRAK